ncbi:MAG: methionyl-tRNA formyltransferase [Eubacterium sp.]|nr:methionyl-tRNA formyltransferase [Eubacterium sp.]
MRIVFMGTPDFSVPTLECLIRKHDVLAVVTQPDRPKGRGKEMQSSPVKKTALSHNIPVFQPAKVRDESFLDILKDLDPDVIIVVAFGQILPETILTLPRYGCINVHASLLPRYRGAAPIQWAVIDGEKETGVTIMYMDKGLDTGDMIARAVVAIDEKETGESLHDKLAVLGGPLLLEVLDQLDKGIIIREKQDDSLSCYAGMLTKDMGRIDWNKDAASIERLVRGLNSWPSAYTFYKNKTLKIWSSDLAEGVEDAVCGEVVRVDQTSFTVQTGRDALRVLEVQLQGKKRMPVQAFLLGNSVEPGMIFGE